MDCGFPSCQSQAVLSWGPNPKGKVVLVLPVKASDVLHSLTSLVDAKSYASSRDCRVCVVVVVVASTQGIAPDVSVKVPAPVEGLLPLLPEGLVLVVVLLCVAVLLVVVHLIVSVHVVGARIVLLVVVKISVSVSYTHLTLPTTPYV